MFPKLEVNQMPRPHSENSIQLHRQINNALRLERVAFAAKVRAARAVMDLSQTELASEIGLTQKSVHRIEQGAVDPKLRTRRAIEQFWHDKGISFDDISGGGFRIVVNAAALVA